MKRLLLSALLTLGLAAGALAQSPQAVVKETTDAILTQLKAPNVQGDEKKNARRQIVRAAMEKRFAWEDSARACLGPQWLKRTPAEKTEFVQLFSEFLKDTYSEKIATYYADLDTVAYRGEKILDGDYASVKLVITTKAKVEHPIEYRMEKTADGWKVYDVVIEGISLVKNYRDQFDAIIAKSSYEGLIKEIKARHPSSL